MKPMLKLKSLVLNNKIWQNEIILCFILIMSELIFQLSTDAHHHHHHHHEHHCDPSLPRPIICTLLYLVENEIPTISWNIQKCWIGLIVIIFPDLHLLTFLFSFKRIWAKRHPNEIKYSKVYLHGVPIKEIWSPAPPVIVAAGPHAGQSRSHVLLRAGVRHVQIRGLTRPLRPAEQVAETNNID